MNRARIVDMAGVAMLGVSTLAMLALHRARPDLDPIRTPVSFYIHGPGSWLLTIALVASGVGVIVIARSLRSRLRRSRGIWVLTAGGTGLIVAGVVPADLWLPWEHALTPMGWVHASAAMLAVGIFPIGALFISRDEIERGRPSLTLVRHATAWIFAVVLVAAGGMTLVYIASGHSPGFLGLVERVLMSLAVLWLVAASNPWINAVSLPAE